MHGFVDDKVLKELVSILDQIPLAITLLDREMRILFINRSVEVGLEIRMEEVRGKRCYEVMGDGSICNGCGARKAIDGGKVCVYNKRIREFVMKNVAVPLKRDGRVIAVLEIGLDITNLTRIRQELEVKEEEYRELFENSLDAIVITNLNGEILKVNEGFERMTGFSREEVIGKHYSILLPENSAKIIFEKYNEAFRRGMDIYTLEFEFFTKSGEKRAAEGSVSLVRRRGEVVAFQGNFRDVTEKKAIEERLKESEELFRKLAERSLIGVYLIQNGIFKYVNPKLAEDLGYRVEEVLGRRFSDFVHPEDRKVVDGLEAEIKGDSVSHKVRVIRKDGETRTFEIIGSKIAFKGEAAVIGTAIDVTKEEAYKKKLEEYRRFYQNAQDLFFILDSKARFVEVNPRYAEMLGYKTEELIGHTARRFFDPSELDVAREMFRRVMEGESVRYEAKAIPKDRKNVYTVEIILWPVFERNRIVGAEGIVRDITERKRMEEKLRESEEMFRALTEKSLVGIYLIQDGVFKYVNPKMAELWGYSVEELIGKSPLEFIHPDDRETVRWNIERRIMGEIDAINYKLKMVRKDGRIRHNEVFGSRIVYRGKPAVIGTLIDITERLELEREKLRAFEQIEKNIENYAILVDQIRNPLAVIQGMCEMRLDGDDKLRELKDTIIDSVNRIEDVVERLERGWLESEAIRKFLKGELRKSEKF